MKLLYSSLNGTLIAVLLFRFRHEKPQNGGYMAHAEAMKNERHPKLRSITSSMESAAERAGDTLFNIQKSFGKYHKSTVSFVKEYPITSLVAALTTGYLIGSVFGRFSKNSS